MIASDLDVAGFCGGASWIGCFLKRKSLALRTRTTMCQCLPADSQEKMDVFSLFVLDTIHEHGMTRDHIINMDKVPLTFDIPMTTTVDKKGAKSVTIQTTEHGKASLTVVLGCCASGKKLPPMLIFKRKTAIKEKLLAGVLVSNNEKGWMNLVSYSRTSYDIS